VDDAPRRPLPSASRPDSLVDWLDQLGVVPGLSSADFDRLASEIERDLASTASIPRCQPAEAFPAFKAVWDGESYKAKIDSSRESIRQGDSYELTLTTAFTTTLDDADPYALYLRLRTFNPAYYSNYMSFPSLVTPRGAGIHVLSSSPERFLRIEKEMVRRVVEMMPIKGTKARIKPGQCVCIAGKGCERKETGSQACLEYAKKVDEDIGQALQADLKERAENLMVCLCGVPRLGRPADDTDCGSHPKRSTVLLLAVYSDCAEIDCA
jgi:para-aminobenzoate synthetase